MTKNISINFPALPSLVIDKGEDAVNVVTRTFSGGYQNAGRSPTGQLRLERENVPRKNEYTVNASCRISDTVTLQRFLDLIEVNPNRQFELIDRWYNYTDTSAGWHNRTIVETFVVGGVNLNYISFPVLLFVPENITPITELGGGLYRLSFIASEI